MLHSPNIPEMSSKNVLLEQLTVAHQGLLNSAKFAEFMVRAYNDTANDFARAKL